MTTINEAPIKRNDPDSLAPVQLDRLTIEEEVSLMDRGKGRQLFALLGGLALLGAVGVVVLRGLEASERRSDAVASLQAVEQKEAAAFLRCALPGVPATKLLAADTMLTALERTSEGLGKRYLSVLTGCAPQLDGFVAAVDALWVPEDASGALDALNAAAADNRSAWVAYQTYLATDTANAVGALPNLEKIALTFITYQQRSEQLVSTLRDAP